jgi:uncharacterized protein YjiK
MSASLRNTILLILMACTTFSCRTRKKTSQSPDGYNLNAISRQKLPLELDEISGLAYYAKDSSVFAINDEKGWIYKLKKGRPIQRWKFSKGADFEDLVLKDSVFYVLQSNGDINRLTFADDGAVQVQLFHFNAAEPGQNEFEILYFDSSKNKLILICKDCESDKKRSLTTFTFDPATGAYSDSSFSIDVKKIATAMGEEKLKFKPSAAAINPRDGLLYIVSAINEMIVTTDLNGNFKSAYRIDGGVFKQPEGIAFTPSGGMMISNEAADVGVADILYFPYHKK